MPVHLWDTLVDGREVERSKEQSEGLQVEGRWKGWKIHRRVTFNIQTLFDLWCDFQGGWFTFREEKPGILAALQSFTRYVPVIALLWGLSMPVCSLLYPRVDIHNVTSSCRCYIFANFNPVALCDPLCTRNPSRITSCYCCCYTFVWYTLQRIFYLILLHDSML